MELEPELLRWVNWELGSEIYLWLCGAFTLVNKLVSDIPACSFHFRHEVPGRARRRVR